jgi:exopolyphosphatase/guanosine-5'-triphosphate,3'-diphosphate pyrophosphatase
VDFEDALLVHQLVCLRLAVILCHARRDPHLAGLALSSAGRQFTLRLPAGWARNYPQSAHLLRQECVAWLKTPWSFALA